MYTIDCELADSSVSIRMPFDAKQIQRQLQYEVKNLNDDTDYECFIMAHNMVTMMKYQSLEQVKKSASTTSIVAKTLNVYEATVKISKPDQVTIYWPISKKMLKMQNSAAGVVYQISRVVEGGEGQDQSSKQLDASSNTNSITLYNLDPEDQYEIRITQPMFKYLAVAKFTTDGSEFMEKTTTVEPEIISNDPGVNPTSQSETTKNNNSSNVTTSKLLKNFKENWRLLALGALAMLLFCSILAIFFCCRKIPSMSDPENDSNDFDHSKLQFYKTSHRDEGPNNNLLNGLNTYSPPLLENSIVQQTLAHHSNQNFNHFGLGQPIIQSTMSPIPNFSPSHHHQNNNTSFISYNNPATRLLTDVYPEVHPETLVGKFAEIPSHNFTFNLVKINNKLHENTVNSNKNSNPNMKSKIIFKSSYCKIFKISSSSNNTNNNVMNKTTQKTYQAIKALTDTNNNDSKIRFLTNACWLFQARSCPNILQIQSLQPEPSNNMMYATEYMTHGDLSEYLTKNCDRIKNSVVLLNLAIDIGKALDYLNERGIVVNNLSTRNILLTKMTTINNSHNPTKQSHKSIDEGIAMGCGINSSSTDDTTTDTETASLINDQDHGQLVAKISNLQCAEYFDNNNNSNTQILLPNSTKKILQADEDHYYRYAAPELVNLNRYNNKSDVYSYGLVLYEIFSKGELPFWNLNVTDLVNLRSQKDSKKTTIAMNLLPIPYFLQNSDLAPLFEQIILHCFHIECSERLTLKNAIRILMRKKYKINQNSEKSDQTGVSSTNETRSSGVQSSSAANSAELDQFGNQTSSSDPMISLNTFLKCKANCKLETLYLLTKNKYRLLSDFSGKENHHKVEKLIGSSEFIKIEKLFSKMNELSFKDLKLLNEMMKKDKTLPTPSLKVDSSSLDAINEFSVLGNIPQRNHGNQNLMNNGYRPRAVSNQNQVVQIDPSQLQNQSFHYTMYSGMTPLDREVNFPNSIHEV